MNLMRVVWDIFVKSRRGELCGTRQQRSEGFRDERKSVNGAPE